MDINQVGLLVAYKRTKDCVSAEEVSEGICSRSFLSRLESGQRGCEKIVAEALLQRVGFASDQLLYFLDDAEYEWLMVKEKLLTAIADVNADEAKRLFGEYRKITYRKSKLHGQFLLLAESVLVWNRYRNGQCSKEETLKTLKYKLWEAWNITRENYPLTGKCPKFLDFQELMIKILFYHLMEEQGQLQEALEGYRDMLRYVEERLESIECVKFYPQLAYRMLLLMERLGQMEEEEEKLYQSYMELIKKEGSMIRLQEVAAYRKGFLQRKPETPEIRREIEELEERISSLEWLYTTYGVRRKDWFTNLLFGREEIYPLSETIKNRRIAFGLSQEKLAEGICDPVSMSRIERGVSSCNNTHLGPLMDKLHLPGGAAVFSVQTGRVDLYDVVAEIKRLSKFSRYEEIEGLFAVLKEKAGSDRYTRQYMLYKEATLQRNRKQIDNQEHWKKQKEAFHLTVPDRPVDELRNWVFSRTEAMIVNALAYGCKQIGKAAETREWLEVVREYYEHQPFHRYHYMKGYELTLENLSDILDQTEDYEQAIAYEDMAIRLALEAERTNVLRVTVYGRGWNMEQLWGSGKYTKENSRPYIRAARILNHLYAKPATCMFIDKKWHDIYE